MSPFESFQFIVQIMIAVGVPGVGYYIIRIDKTLAQMGRDLHEAVTNIAVHGREIELQGERIGKLEET